jgi:lysyl-tRNA synthetase class 2
VSDDWRPAASLAHLRLRGELLARARAFFAARGVLEVETPLLGAATVTDPHLASLATRFAGPGAAGGRALYLQTSPEYAMKRLLAAGSGPIYQFARAFRDGEAGRRHNPEFTLLEWYRPEFDHHALMDEMDAFLGLMLGSPPAERLTYRELFARHLGVDPLTAQGADPGELDRAAVAAGLDPADLPALDPEDRDTRLDLLVSHLIEPRLPLNRPTFVYDYPASQAALARLRVGEGVVVVAERFEVFAGGLELANGFHELADPAEQRRRFAADLARRRALGLPAPPVDERLLAALATGLPDCAGVALGFDRLVMLAAGAASIEEVLAFPVDRA